MFLWLIIKKKIEGVITYLILALKAMQPVPGLKLELRTEQAPMREVEEPGEEGVIGGWFPVARICVQPNVQGLDQGLAMLLAAGVLVQGVVSRK